MDEKCSETQNKAKLQFPDRKLKVQMKVLTQDDDQHFS